jgi:UDP:flavonoid glycosyltransferase YjiC (YdhE family)
VGEGPSSAKLDRFGAQNARRVQAAGSGLIVAPGPELARTLGEGVRRVLEEEHFQSAAEAVAAEMARQPTLATAVRKLEELASVH